MLSKHGGGRHNACGALSHMPRAVVGAVLGLVLVRVQGQSEASPIVCMGRFHPLSRGESSMFQLLKAFVFVGSLLWLLAPAEAVLLTDQTVQTTYLFPDTSTIFAGPTDSIVGAGVELTNFAGLADVDFSDTNIFITANRDAAINAVAFDGLQFADVNGTIPAFTSVTLNAVTNYAGLNATRVSFDTDHIFLNLVGLPGQAGQVISLDINPLAATVPEPSTWLLLATGFASLLGYGWRHRQQGV